MIFQPVKVALTGMAAPIKEMEDIKKTIISKDLGPVELQAAIDELKSMATDAVRLRRRLLAEGFSPDDEDFEQVSAVAWENMKAEKAAAKGATKAQPKGDQREQVKTRLAELMKSGMSRDDAVSRVKQEMGR
jgi:hypothetical protein